MATNKRFWVICNEEDGGEGSSGGTFTKEDLDDFSDSLGLESEEDVIDDDLDDIGDEEKPEEKPGEEPEGDEKPEEGEADKEDPSAKKEVIEPPKSWRPEALADWDKLSATVQKEVLKREEDFFKGIEQYKTAAQYAQTVESIVAPYRESLKVRGYDPLTYTANILELDNNITRAAPEEKIAFFKQLAGHYGLTINEDFFAEEDSNVAALKTELRQIKQQIEQQSTQTQKAVVEQRMAEIETFSKDPANIHFNTVSEDMAKLFETGAARTLKEAYDKAIWLNPVTRAAEIKRQSEETLKEAELRRKKEVEDAKKKAATNVKSNGKAVRRPVKLNESLTDTMTETMEAISKRDGLY